MSDRWLWRLLAIVLWLSAMWMAILVLLRADLVGGVLALMPISAFVYGARYLWRATLNDGK